MDFAGSLGLSAGLGLLKDLAFDVPREQRDRRVAAAQMRYSPWTRIPAQQIHTANPVGDALQYGLTGAGLFQSDESQKSDAAFKAAMIDAMKTKGPNPWGLSTGSGGPSLGVPALGVSPDIQAMRF